MRTRIFYITALILISAAALFAQPRAKSNNEKLITALIGAEEVRGVYGDDGMYIFTQAPEIERIFKLGSKAIPLLIAHLDDKRLLSVSTNYTNDEGERVDVTIGAASFDFLTMIIH